MKRRAMISLMILSFLMIIFLPAAFSAAEGGLLPSLTETVGIAMPSLGEALGRYPVEEMENGDGSITELYTNVSEADFSAFSVYLEQQKAELADYKVEKGVLTADIWAKGATFSLSYDSKSGEARATYPSGTFDEWVKNAKTHFDTAQKLLGEGKTDEAYAEITVIPLFMKYGPVTRLMKEDENLAAVREAKYAPYKEVGNVILFGIYPQTKKGTDQTPIEWIVLDYDETNHKTLLISKYGLDTVPYNKECTDITWAQCTLRTWLNDEFLNKAFSAKEQSAILITNVDNSSSQGYSKWNTDGGNNTQDRIFLLSYAEVNRYFGVKYYREKGAEDNIAARIAPTAYAIAKGAGVSKNDNTEDGKLAGWWWLRSPADAQYGASDVDCEGAFLCLYVDNDTVVVRPVFWLNLNSDLF